MATFIAIAGLLFAAGSFVYAALTYHVKDRKGPTTTAPQSPYFATPPVHDPAQPPAQGISWPIRAYPQRRSINRQPQWVFVSAWSMAGLIIVGELVGFVNPGKDLGWLGLSAAGIGLAVAVPLTIRLERTADDDYIGTLIGVLFWALVVIVIRSFFPDLMILEITWPGGVLRL
ncbi:hypothetical protein [Nonomuraea guangzhouensis]|uniref:Tripartite tricarboxylate transporter TctB family protein n=1 Tax=Nonomuraea guangzhouensis TaxID=1291555 RepID=A0ABW4G2M0_9ACTN|nr:hypothetical protein [Nonomuraea guangzhouensis]